MSISSLVASVAQTSNNTGGWIVTFGELLKQKRRAVKMSQETLAEMISARGHSISNGSISNIERNYYLRKDGSPARLERDFVVYAAEVLGSDVNEFLTAANLSLENGEQVSLPGVGVVIFLKDLAADEIERWKLVLLTAIRTAKAMMDEQETRAIFHNAEISEFSQKEVKISDDSRRDKSKVQPPGKRRSK